jgi:TonB family protein
MASVSVAQQPDGNQSGGESAVPRAGVNGITAPRCIHCPQPQYSKEALKAKVSGVVFLDVTVTTEGKVINPVVVKGPGVGLNERALEQVRKWKMRPALSQVLNHPAGGAPIMFLKIEMSTKTPYSYSYSVDKSHPVGNFKFTERPGGRFSACGRAGSGSSPHRRSHFDTQLCQ